MWQAGTLTTRTVVIGDGFLAGASGTAAGNIVTNNSLTIEAGGSMTNVSTMTITASNTLNLLGGWLAANIVSNSGGTYQAYGTQRGTLVVTNRGLLRVRNSLGAFVVSNSFTLASNSTMQVELGTSFNSMFVGLQVASGNAASNSLILAGTLNFTDSGGFGPGTNTLITFGTGAAGTNVTFTPTIGTVPSPDFSYTLTTNITLGHIDLIVVCTNNCAGPSDPFTAWQTYYFPADGPNAQPNADPDGDGTSNTNEFLAGFNPTNSAAYLHVISVAASGIDEKVTYLGGGGDTNGSPGPKTNILEFTTGSAGGSYSNNFTSTGQTNVLSDGSGLGVTTNMVDSGGATNVPSRYYRVRVLLP